MISVNVKSNTKRQVISCDVIATPKSVFTELGVDTSTSMVCLNGTVLSAVELIQTFEDLGVEDGSVAILSSIVKADGARM